MTANGRIPLLTEEQYQETLRKTLGEELAAICNLRYEERLQAIDEFQRHFDTPKISFGQQRAIQGRICHSTMRR